MQARVAMVSWAISSLWCAAALAAAGMNGRPSAPTTLPLRLAQAAPELTVCPPGMQLVNATNCCWPGQQFSEERQTCKGRPICPAGLVAAGATCVAAPAAPPPPPPPTTPSYSAPTAPPTYSPPAPAPSPPASGYGQAGPPSASYPPAAPAAAPGAGACFPACRNGFLCWNGQCVSACNPPCGPAEQCTDNGTCVGASPPSSAYTPLSATAGPAAGSVSAASRTPDTRAVHLKLNAGGFLGYGPSAGIEIGTRTSVYARGRLVNLGIVSTDISFSNVRDEETQLSWGAAASVRWYSNSTDSVRGIYVGGALEYLDVRTSSVVGVRHAVLGLCPEFEAGYRWVLGTFTVGVGGSAGYFIPISKQTTTFPGESSRTPDQLRKDFPINFNGAPFLELQLEFGILL